MSKGEALRDFMKERLTAAAEEIFAQFESTIAEFGEELRRCKEVNQRKQSPLESDLSPGVVLLRTDEKTSPGPGLNQDPNQEIPETSQIKDEPEEESVTHMEECVPESSAVCVKTEESSLLQQTEHKQDEPQSDQDEDWTAPFSCSDDEDHHNQIRAQNSDLSPKYKSATETRATVNNGDQSGTARGAEGKMQQCPVCNKRLKGYKRDLQAHMRIHTGERPYSCSTCNKAFTQLSTLARHRITHAGERPCEKTSPQPVSNQEIPETSQIKDEPEEPSIKHQCVPESSAVCVKTEESSLLQQTDKQDEPQGDQDEDWTAPFSCSDDEDHHNQIRAQNSDVSTRDKPGTTEGAEGKMQQCPVCKKRLKGYNCDLQVHMRIHTGERPYSCSTCNKTFVQKHQLISHRRIHTGEKPYSCSTCNRRFTQRNHLITHRRTHTGERPYSCSICNKTFTQLGNLTYHRRTHIEERPCDNLLQCPICEKRLKGNKSDLKKHMRIHTGERPYSCSICSKTFALCSYLNIHKRTHTGERPYSCSMCSKSFTSCSNLNRHKRTHTLQLFDL